MCLCSTIPDKQAVRAKRKAILYPSLPWGLSPILEAPRDGAVFLQWWDVIIAFSCLYIAFSVPFTLGFERVYFRGGDQCLFSPGTPPPFTTFRWVDIVVDLLFVIDIAINFISARWILRSVSTCVCEPAADGGAGADAVGLALLGL